MLAMEYMNPDNRKDGKKVSTMANWLAGSCDRVIILINRPVDTLPLRFVDPP